MAIFLIGALLGEVAVYIAKLLGFDYEEDQTNVDFLQRLENGEVLDSENMFK